MKSVNHTKDSTNEAIPILENSVLTSATRPVYLSIEDAERYSPECVEVEIYELRQYGVLRSSPNRVSQKFSIAPSRYLEH